MENFNTRLSSESIRNVNALIQKIEGVCKDIEKSLAMCFELSGDSVAIFRKSRIILVISKKL